jgi:pilus assembly protein Flp/PilA
MEQFMSRLMELSRSAAVWLKVTSNRGVSAIEYGLLAALIALVIIAAVTTLGTNLSSVFSGISTSI